MAEMSSFQSAPSRWQWVAITYSRVSVSHLDWLAGLSKKRCEFTPTVSTAVEAHISARHEHPATLRHELEWDDSLKVGHFKDYNQNFPR